MNRFETLKLNKEFRRTYGRGRSFVHPLLVTYALPNRNAGIRIGITAGKKIGSAVQRNRAKRVIMAAFRKCVPNLCVSGYDFVFVARMRTGASSSEAVYTAMMRHFQELGIWEHNDETVAHISD